MKITKVVITLALLALFVALVIIGQKSIGVGGLLLMLAGLCGLLAMLYAYNRQFQ